jgi:hypothetical protein
VDAPELRQPGYLPNGSTVPVGQQSRDALGDLIGSGDALTGPTVMRSWGRPVAPLSVGGVDAGQQMVRSGNAFAAPGYVDDPAYRALLMQAERLARLNRLGPVNDAYVQKPAEFRDDPKHIVPRETVAQFWDTPTPNSGLPAEVEQKIAALTYDKDTPLGAVLEYARSQGAILKPESVKASRDHFLKTGQAGGLEYLPTEEILTDTGTGASGAAVRGIGQGFVAGGLDELGAVADTLIPSIPGFNTGRENVWNSDRRVADIWANNQRQNSSILGYDREFHPYASYGGEIGGALTSGFVIPFGQGARTVPQLARVGGAWGATEGFLGTDGDVPQRLTGAAIGAPIGAIAGAGLGKTVEVGAPVVASGARRLFGRNGNKAARTADHAAAGHGEEKAEEGAVRPPQRPGADEWAEFPDAPQGRSIGTDAEPVPSVSGELRQRDVIDVTAPARATRLDQPLTDAQRRAMAEDVRPQDVLPIPSNEVGSVDEAAAIDAGRIAPAKAPNERGAIRPRTITSYTGQPVPKAGPLDMVGWLRSQGGLRDQAGELASMGISNNAARRGLDFVGPETRFGPMVNNERGMTLDDAALAAWEAGYFPEHTARPDINTFLEAVGETYNGGRGRRFLPEDAPELEGYYGRQAERYDLERQELEASGPVFVDRSSPAEEPAPFPPVEAYEEWPADSVSRAGNINLDKLDSPQDIKRALVQTNNRVGFDAATRGRVTQAETERLASELNMTPEKLLSRRNGQSFNAEEALAARQLLAKSGNELVNAAKRIKALEDPGDELLAEFRRKWMRHVAIQEQVSGMTAEAGRTLQQFRMAADSRAIRGDVLNAFVRGGGGKDNLQDAAGRLIDAVEMGPGKFNALAEKATKPKWHRKIGELYINMLLSNPPMHIVNMVSNTLTAMAQIPEYATGAAIGAARRAVVGKAAKERILASEVGARTFGLLQGTREGARLFAKALRTGEADDFVSKVEGDEFKAISGLKGEIIRIPTRLLTAEDQLFKGIARRMELNAQAVRLAHREGLTGEARDKRIAELIADPTDAMLERAMDYGRYLTFQRKLGDFGQAVSRASGSNLLAKVIVPFVRTPMNLLKFATERSPAAPVLKEWRADFLAGGERRDLAVAKVLLGSGFATVMYQAAKDGLITGAVPPDPAKARLLYANGWQPYSFKIGERYVSFSRLDPLSTTLGVAADMATLPDGLSDRQQDDRATMLVASIMGNLASKTWLSGASAFTEALSDPGRYADNWLQRTAGAFAVPAGVAGVARAIDPVSRRRESVGEAIQARVPGMTDELLPRRDIFGEAIVNDSLGPDFLSPFWQSQAKNDPVVAEMLRIDKSVSAPGKQYTDEGERIDYAPEEYDRYHEIAGRLTYNSLLGLIGSGEYQALDDTGKRKAAKKAITKARETARGVLNDPDYPLPPKGTERPHPGAAPGGAASWPGQPVGGASAEQWPGQPVERGASSAEQWPGQAVPQADVVGRLQGAIPGVRFTSGFRTPEYQADMRRRGYKPASNSAHLDGSALDMLPPPGKSLGWLRGAVAKAEPDARLLVHDGHLHATFPGWFGAPVLGRARSAGLSNPVAGKRG